jgi:hypothetical protein
MYKYAVENFEKNGKEWHWKNLESTRIAGGGKARESESAGQNPPKGMKKLKNFEKIKRGK